MSQLIVLRRPNTEIPYGFKLQGWICWHIFVSDDKSFKSFTNVFCCCGRLNAYSRRFRHVRAAVCARGHTWQHCRPDGHEARRCHPQDQRHGDVLDGALSGKDGVDQIGQWNSSRDWSVVVNRWISFVSFCVTSSWLLVRQTTKRGNVVDTTKLVPTPIAQLKVNKPVNPIVYNNMAPSLVPTNLTIEKSVRININA